MSVVIAIGSRVRLRSNEPIDTFRRHTPDAASTARRAGFAARFGFDLSPAAGERVWAGKQRNLAGRMGTLVELDGDAGRSHRRAYWVRLDGAAGLELRLWPRQLELLEEPPAA